MTKDSVRTREEELYYASCPICSTTLLQAETVINCIVKCEQCHQRIKRIMRELIIDTDIGIDCDDALALAAAVALEKQNKISLCGVSVCTARAGAASAVAAIGKHFGRAIEVSAYGGKPLDCDGVDVYADALRSRYGAVGAGESGVRFLRRKLLQAREKVVLASIGPLSNIAALIGSTPDELSPLSGVDLIAEKVETLYCMGGNFMHLSGAAPSTEWNVAQDVESCRILVERFPADIVFAPYEVGCDVLSGSVFDESDPVGYAVRLFYQKNPHEFRGEYSRSSWDPITGCAAAGEPFFALSEYGTVHVTADGITQFRPGAGRHRYLIKRQPDGQTARTLDALYATLL